VSSNTIFKIIFLNFYFFQDFYNKIFSSSRLQIHSGIDMSHCSTENGLNLFLIPRKSKEGKKYYFRSFIEN